MKPLNELVATVAKIAEKEGYTPLGLLDYLRDLDKFSHLYGSDLDRDRIEERLFGGTGIGAEDVTTKVCSLAMSYHLQHIRDSIRRWQREADEAKIPVTYVLVGDSELGYEAVMRDRWRKGVVVKDTTPQVKKSSVKGPTMLGQPVGELLLWMGLEGWDLADARGVLAMYGGECPDAEILAGLKAGREGPDYRPIPDRVVDKLREALE